MVLGEAHRSEPKLLHLDLKPDNLFLAETGLGGEASVSLKLLDFGIARLLAPDRTSTMNDQPRGTPAWMAPEQVQAGQKMGPETDVWALGLVAFWMCTGAYYWRTMNKQPRELPELLVEIVYGALDPASTRAVELRTPRGLPNGFDAWFARCVHRDRKARFANAGDATDVLLGLWPEAGAQAATSATVGYAGPLSMPRELDPQWHFEEAIGHERGGRRDKARAHLDAALGLAPERAECWAARSRVRRMEGDLDGAMADAGEALSRAPENVAAREASGRARAARGEWAAAGLDFTAVLMHDPSRADMHAARSECFVRLGMMAEARMDTARAGEVAPGVWPTVVLAVTGRVGGQGR